MDTKSLCHIKKEYIKNFFFSEFFLNLEYICIIHSNSFIYICVLFHVNRQDKGRKNGRIEHVLFERIFREDWDFI